MIRFMVQTCCGIWEFSKDNQLSDSELTVGVMTKQLICRLLENGDIDENAMKTFYKSVRAYYVDATTQALQKLLFADDLLNIPSS